METMEIEGRAQQPPSIWQNRTFLWIWVGHTISIVGNGFNSVALGLWVLQTTGSAKAMALIMSVRIIISILLGAVAGTVVDRSDRRRLMIITNLIRFITVGVIALLIKSSLAVLWPIIALTTVTGVAAEFFAPAFQASLVQIVGPDELPKASSLLQVTNTLAQIAGPFFGGTVVALFGGWVALAGDAVSFLVAALALLVAGTFPSPRGGGASERSFTGDLKEGLRYIWGDPVVRGVVGLAPILNFFGNAVGVLLPVIAVKVWLADSVTFGTIEALFPTGFAIGAALIMVLIKRMQHKGLWMTAGASLTGVAIAGVAAMPSVTSAMPMVLLTGVAMAVVNVLLQVTLQARVEPAVQGRVFGAMSSLLNIASPLSMLLAGVLGDLFSPSAITVGAGVMMAICGLGFLLAPGIRQLA